MTDAEEASALAAEYAKEILCDRTRFAAGLEHYAALLRKWQRAQNLVSRETLSSLWKRHLADSLQLLPLLTEADQHFLDLGSGGGLPAIPLALSRADDPGSRFLLVEPNLRKAAFLRTVVRELSLGATIVSQRIENIDSRETSIPDLITARGLTRLVELCRLMAPFFGPETRALLHKGREYGDELAETHGQWQFDVLIHPSRTHDGSAILELRNLRAV